VFRDHRTELIGVQMDESGVLVEALGAALERLPSPPKLFYTIPNFHNPTGVTVTQARRESVLALARRRGFLIVEDDVYRELAFEGGVPPSYYALAGGRGVLRLGSFSKTLAPGLRLGWLMGEPSLIEACMACGAMQMGGGANPFAANVVAAYCASADWDAHIDRLRAIYRAKRDAALAALERWMPDGVVWTRPDGGFFLWLTLPPGVDVADVERRSRERGVLFAAGPGFFVTPEEGKRHLRLAFSFAAPEEIGEGIRILASAIADCL
jgi:2-aminoadipate transaminase